MMSLLVTLGDFEGHFVFLLKTLLKSHILVDSIYHPPLKENELDSDTASNYRSSPNTISKMLERLFVSHIQPHVKSSANFSRYRRGH